MIIKLKKDITVAGVEKLKGKILEVTGEFGRQLIAEKKAVEVRTALFAKGVRRQNGKLTTDAAVPERDDETIKE